MTRWAHLESAIASRFLRFLATPNLKAVASLSPKQREYWATLMADAVNSAISPSPISAEAARYGQELKEKGVTVLGPILTDAEAREAREYFLTRPVYNTHAYGSYGAPKSDEIPRIVGSGAEQFRFGSYPVSDVIGMPHFLKVATHPSIVGAAREFLGAQPTIYSINAWWSFADQDSPGIAQQFHRDMDYTRFCSAFVFLTDVDAESGPHHYFEYSHDLRATKEVLKKGNIDIPAKSLFEDAHHNYGQDDTWSRIWKDHLREVTGPAGTTFMANTYGLHRGLPPVRHHRLVMWVRYTLFASPPLAIARIKPDFFRRDCPADEHTRYVLRGILEE